MTPSCSTPNWSRSHTRFVSARRLTPGIISRWPALAAIATDTRVAVVVVDDTLARAAVVHAGVTRLAALIVRHTGSHSRSGEVFCFSLR